MRTALVSPKTLKPGDSIVVVSAANPGNIDLVPVEIGKVVAIKHGDKVVAYKVYPQAWLDDEALVARTAAMKHLAPRTVTTRAKVEKVVA